MLRAEDLQIRTLGAPRVASPLRLSSTPRPGLGQFVREGTRIRYQAELRSGETPLPDEISFEKAGPRERLFFEPAQSTAAIVTCGGLCPGLNNVIRSLVLELRHNYGVPRVLGIRQGYRGLNPASSVPPLELTTDVVESIHRHGGTLLASSRGPQEPAVMVDYLHAMKIDMLFCLGGDGTQRGAHAIGQEIARRGLPIAVVGIPKTIDNDIPFVHRTFGFATALEKAEEVLRGAHVEARGVDYGIGLVKLMGRHAGFIALHATLASQDVNYLLPAEIRFPLHGPDGLLASLEARLADRRHALIAVAEGAGQDLLPTEPVEYDASGNVRNKDIGLFLKDQIERHFAAIGKPVSIKYIDPSYFIRSVPANAADAILCDQLGRGAAHAALAGKTDLMLGYWSNEFTHVPIPLATSHKRQIDLTDDDWNAALACTGQPRWAQD